MGKVLGVIFGWLLGGPLGALLGLVVGHAFDAGMHKVSRAAPRVRVQSAFFTTVFSVLGHLAKVDGRVNENEIRLAEAVMDRMGLPPALRDEAKALFRRGKEPDFPLDETLRAFALECRHSPELIVIFLEVLLRSAYADGVMHTEEARVLRQVCERLGFPRQEFERLESMVRASFGADASSRRSGAAQNSDLSIEQAYRILGCTAQDSDAEVKKRYRVLINQHHPDKLIAKGVPEEMVKIASERTVEIRKAYEKLRKARGF
ncbi:MAG: co-chaperone DjlA [Chromatiales bacterium]|jgi:DnaJ like chaperone protein|nr:co-chaperone DjlA [Chromatiales bacterium]